MTHSAATALGASLRCNVTTRIKSLYMRNTSTVGWARLGGNLCLRWLDYYV
jgi:hypothetical protein